MQMVYFWIEKNEILENQGINFNSGFYFEMKKNDDIYMLERIREKEKEIPKNFFGEGIKNISCIIGENGSGKTTLIRSIINSKHSLQGHNIVGNYLIIFEENGKFYLKKDIKNINVKINIEYSKDNYIRPKYVYFNTEILKTPINYIVNVLDISLGNDIYKSGVEKETNKEERIVNGSEILTETVRQKQFRRIDFLSEKKEILEEIPYLEFKKKLQYIHKNKKINMKIKNEISMKEEFDKNYYSLYFKKLEVVDENIYENFISILWSYICFNLSRKDIKKELQDFLKNILIRRKKGQDIFSWIKTNLKIISRKEFDEVYKLETENGVGCYKKILIEMSEINKLKRLVENFEKLDKEREIINNREIQITIERFNEIFYKNITIANKIFDYYLEVRFSNGEEIFLDFLIKLYNIKGTIEANGELKSVILFLEELESFMHPEWQRKVIDFLRFLKNNIPWMKKIDVQVILVSHTPFLVGDIPGENIFYFKDGELIRNEHKTFGGNIYDILKESFLMKSCFGEFSKQKIEKVIRLLSKDENNNYKEDEIEINRREIEFLIDSLGEDLIKNRLKKMYNEYKESKNNTKNIDEKNLEEIIKLIKDNGLEIDDIVKGYKDDKDI